jgi:hypothetical protein
MNRESTSVSEGEPFIAHILAASGRASFPKVSPSPLFGPQVSVLPKRRGTRPSTSQRGDQ